MIGLPTDELPDARLIELHVAGDRDAFGVLVHRHRDRLWAVALRTLGNQEDAADAVQEALVSAYRKASSFRGDAAVTTWLHRIVVNACLDYGRRKSARPTVAVNDSEALDTLARDTGTRDSISHRERSLDVQDALRTLPLEQRGALVLVDMAGYSVDEAASILEVPAGTVKSRCARARARLAPLLAHLRNQPPPGDVSSSDRQSSGPSSPPEAKEGGAGREQG